MFTGLIEETGKIFKIEKRRGSACMQISCEKIPGQAVMGDSIAVNGICLTVTKKDDKSLFFDLSPETLSRTTFPNWKPGMIVNLEQSLTPDSLMGGHFVQGHVDCRTKVMEIQKEGGFSKIVFELPVDIAKYIVEKGPVAIDGISLTVASIDERKFDVAVIPETIRRTNIQTYESGTMVNIEADLMAKYIEKMLKQDKGKNQPEFFSEENLKKLGYI